MAQSKNNSLNISYVSLAIIGAILILGLASYFIYSNFSVKEGSFLSTPPDLTTGINYTIEIKNYTYTPSYLEINVGDTITWINLESSLVHTITSKSYSPLRSSTLKLDQTFSLRFTEVGTYDYSCLFHKDMNGTIVVK